MKVRKCGPFKIKDMDLKALVQTVNQIAEEKGIEPDKVIEAIEGALSSAYKREYDKRDFNISAKLDPETGRVKFTQIMEVVDKDSVRRADVPDEEIEVESREGEEGEEKQPRFSEDRHIMLEEAKKIKKDAKVGDELEFPIKEE